MFPVIRSPIGRHSEGGCGNEKWRRPGPPLAGIQFNDSAFVIQPGITGALSFWFLALRGRQYYPGTAEFSFFFLFLFFIKALK